MQILLQSIHPPKEAEFIRGNGVGECTSLKDHACCTVERKNDISHKGAVQFAISRYFNWSDARHFGPGLRYYLSHLWSFSLIPSPLPTRRQTHIYTHKAASKHIVEKRWERQGNIKFISGETYETNRTTLWIDRNLCIWYLLDVNIARAAHCSRYSRPRKGIFNWPDPYFPLPPTPPHPPAAGGRAWCEMIPPFLLKF